MIEKSTRVITKSLEKTRLLGQRVGSHLNTRTLIALTGDLGSGKTMFTQGLAIGLEVSKGYRVTSPSYNLINEYPGRLPLYHVDLYRIAHVDELEDIGFYDILQDIGIVVIEWADRLSKQDLGEHLHLHFTIVDDTSREIRIQGYGTEASRLISAIGALKNPTTGRESPSI